jgi:hypothetical protein
VHVPSTEELTPLPASVDTAAAGHPVSAHAAGAGVAESKPAATLKQATPELIPLNSRRRLTSLQPLT